MTSPDDYHRKIILFQGSSVENRRNVNGMIVFKGEFLIVNAILWKIMASVRILLRAYTRLQSTLDERIDLINEDGIISKLTILSKHVKHGIS